MMIRPMEEKDLEKVIVIEEALFSDAWSLDGFKETLRQPEADFLVAEDDRSGIVGYCGCYRAVDEAEIVNVAVRSDYQNRGAGKRLVEQLIAKESAAGVRYFVLEVRMSNEAAKHVYEKAGFRPVGIRRRFYDHPAEDALIMQKENITDDK